MLVKNMLEHLIERLREAGVAAERRGVNEVFFPAAQLRAAYAATDSLEAEAKTRRLKVHKYLEMYRGAEVQVIGVEL